VAAAAGLTNFVLQILDRTTAAEVVVVRRGFQRQVMVIQVMLKLFIPVKE
jgi:hypothetical protein